MGLSTCDNCGGHIPLGPHETNRCTKCGSHVMGGDAGLIKEANDRLNEYISLRGIDPKRWIMSEKTLRCLVAEIERNDGIDSRQTQIVRWFPFRLMGIRVSRCDSIDGIHVAD